MLVISLIWMVMVDENPEDGRKRSDTNLLTNLKIASQMSDEELDFMLSDRSAREEKFYFRDVPWRSLFKSYPILIAGLAWL